jgi:cyclophilin family peptidyl-prolyl cis-trans isomerase
MENNKETNIENLPKDNKKTYLWVFIIIVIFIGIYMIWPKGSAMQVPLESATQAQIDAKINRNKVAEDSTLIANNTKNFMHNIKIETNKGTIVIETYDADAPKTVENFITLANKDFYNGTIFHRVINGFMIQGGDPTGTGRGGPGYSFPDELNPSTESYKIGYKRGVVAMANAGPNTNGSQFFIMHKDNPLPNNYTIFGRVVSGMEVVDAIASTKTAPGDAPIEKMVMNKVTVSEVKK